jgi:hypothetical protein
MELGKFEGMMNSVFKGWSAVLVIIALITVSLSAHADGIDNDILKKMLNTGKAAPVDDGILRLTTNKNKLVRLDQDAASVIVNNPEHAEVMLDSPRLLIVMPRAPGATSFIVLDANGRVILRKEIIVSNVQPQYVRIRRMCGSSDSACAATSYYYCPNGCYEVTAVGDTGNSAAPPPATAPAAAQAGGGAPAGQPPAAPQNPVSTTTAPSGATPTPGGGL